MMSGYCRASNVTSLVHVPTQLVDTQDALAEFLQRWKTAPFLALDTEPGAAAALLALERSLSDRLPFRDLATQLHVLAVRR